VKRIIELELQDNSPKIETELDFKGEIIRADEEALAKEYQNGYNTGHTEGYGEGHSVGYAKGDSAGYNRGFSDGKNSITVEQSNYEENDPESPAYIQNRPFYTSTGEITLEKSEDDLVIFNEYEEGYEKIYKVAAYTIDDETLATAKINTRVSVNGSVVEEVEANATDSDPYYADWGCDLGGVVIVRDYVACNEDFGLTLNSNGIYFGEFGSKLDDGTFEVTEYTKLVYFGEYIKLLDNKYLDLTKNADYQIALQLAKGANQAMTFDNYQEMAEYFRNLSPNLLNIGQNIMIVNLNVPDLWVSGTTDESGYYYSKYTDDRRFVDDLGSEGSIHVGYYYLSALETQKVNLSEYDQKMLELEQELRELRNLVQGLTS
jgi:hypothetical protein